MSFDGRKPKSSFLLDTHLAVKSLGRLDIFSQTVVALQLLPLRVLKLCKAPACLDLAKPKGRGLKKMTSWDLSAFPARVSP